MEMSLNFIRIRFDKQLDSLGKEICLLFLALFFLFIFVLFVINFNKNGYYLFFIISYGYMANFLFSYSVKNLQKPHKDIEDKFIENNYIQNVDVVTNVLINDISQHNLTENNYIQNVDEISNVLINDISQHNFTENNYINNLEFVTNDFSDKIKDNNQSLEKEKCEIKKIDKEYKFNIRLIKKINKVKSNLKLSSKTDFAILFLYVQHFVLISKISNSEMIRQINNLFEFEQFYDAHYSQISNDLFEWKNDKEMKKMVKNVLNGSKYYDKFNEIMLGFKNLK